MVLIASLLFIVGALAMVIGTIGLIRLPDVFNRMHATTISSTVGVGSILLGAAIYLSRPDHIVGSGSPTGPMVKILAAVIFLFLSAPVGAFMLSRAAYVSGVPLAKQTARNDAAADHGVVTEKE